MEDKNINGFSLFNDIVDDDLRVRNRAIAMGNIVAALAFFAKHESLKSASGHERKSVTATRRSAFGGKAEVDFGPLDVSL